MTHLAYYITLLTSISIIIATYFHPTLDIDFSGVFFVHGQGFIYANIFFPKLVFILIPIINKGGAILLALALIYAKLYKNPRLFYSTRYLLISLALSVGLIVNVILKEKVGRARPIDIKEFGGNQEFSQVFVNSDQCNHNCSFPSGHAAGIFWITICAYLVDKKRFNKVFSSLMFIATIMAVCRIVQGGHFLSDVAFAAFVVLITNHILERFLHIRPPA